MPSCEQGEKNHFIVRKKDLQNEIVQEIEQDGSNFFLFEVFV